MSKFYSEEDLIALTSQLVRAKSVSGNSIEAAHVLINYFKDHDLDPILDQYKDGEANVYLKIGPPDTDVVIISGHLDVVPPGKVDAWTHPPFSGQIVNDHVWGRGSADMKGGLAVIASIMVNLVKLPLKQQVLFIATGEEETGLLGSKHVITTDLYPRERISHILIAEPTGLQPLISEKGVMWIKVIATGKQSHGSRPDLGVNAIQELVVVLQHLLDQVPKIADERVGGVSINTTTIQGGDALNVGAETAEVTLDVRIPAGIENKTVVQTMQDILNRAVGDNLTFELEILYDEPAIRSSDTSLGELLADSTERVTNTRPDLGTAHYTTDGTVFMTALDQSVHYAIFGPGSPDLLHQTDEQIAIKQLLQAKQIMLATISELVL